MTDIDELEKVETAGLSTFELRETIQASETQLKRALNDMCAIHLKQKWKVIKELDEIILEISRAICDER